MPDDARAALPQPELDIPEQFSRRIQTSKRTVSRLISAGMEGVVSIGDLSRIDPAVALDWLRNRNKPKPVRRGRPAKKAQR